MFSVNVGFKDGNYEMCQIACKIKVVVLYSAVFSLVPLHTSTPLQFRAHNIIKKKWWCMIRGW